MTKQLKHLNFDKDNAQKTFHYLIKKVVWYALHETHYEVDFHKLLVVATNRETYCLDEVLDSEFEADESIRFMCLILSDDLDDSKASPKDYSVEEIRIAYTESRLRSLIYNLTLADLLEEINSSMNELDALKHCPISLETLTVPIITSAGKSYSEAIWKNVAEGNWQEPLAPTHCLLRTTPEGKHELRVQDLVINKALFSLTCTIVLNSLINAKQHSRFDVKAKQVVQKFYEEILSDLKNLIVTVDELKAIYGAKVSQAESQGLSVIPLQMYLDLQFSRDLNEQKLNVAQSYFARMDQYLPADTSDRIGLMSIISPVFIIAMLSALQSENALLIYTALITTFFILLPMMLVYLFSAFDVIQIKRRLADINETLANSITLDTIEQRNTFYNDAVSCLDELKSFANKALAKFAIASAMEFQEETNEPQQTESFLYPQFTLFDSTSKQSIALSPPSPTL